MTLRNWSLALVVLLLVAPLSANALGISIESVSSTGSSVTFLDGGDIITFNLVVENATAEEVFGLGLGVYVYDDGSPGDTFDNRLVFAGGQNSASILSTTFVPGTPNQAFGGLLSSGPVHEDGVGFPINQERRVVLFNALSLDGTNGNGTNDVGINGNQTNGADVHLQVSFLAQELEFLGDVTLTFGVGQFGNAAIGDGGTILAFYNDSYNLTVIPEPGTALLMGLGLAGLAANRRR